MPNCFMNAAYCENGMQKPSGTLAAGGRADFSAPRFAALTPQWRLSRTARASSGFSACTVRSGLGSTACGLGGWLPGPAVAGRSAGCTW